MRRGIWSDWTRALASIIACAALGMVMGRVEAARARPVVPVETAQVRARWAGHVPVRRVVDEATGTPCIEYAQSTPQRPGEFWTEIERVDLDRYDVLRFRWKMAGDPATATVSIEGYPAPDGRRNYYLLKRPNPPGQWQDVWLDLRQDDDGVVLEKAQVPAGKIRLRFQVALSDMGQLPERPQIRFRVANIRFVRYPVTLSGDLAAVTTFRDGERAGQRYPLTLTNRTEKPQNVSLWSEPADLRDFSVALSEERVRLRPRETRRVIAEISVSAERAEALPPLACEQAGVFATVNDDPDLITTWYEGFLLYRLVGAVPLPERPAPRLLPQEEARAGWERLAGRAKPAAVDRRRLAEANQLLDVSPEPPDMLHGNPNHYFDPRTNSILRFHAPGKHWSEKEKKYIDLSELPEQVQRAGAYAHHCYLSSGALKLAEVGWQTGDRRYFRKAAEILLAYARHYPRYAYARPAGVAFRSRVGWAVLQESWWYRPLPCALDLVRASGVLTAEEDRAIVEGVILPAAIHLRTHRSVANQQAEYNSGVGIGALVAGHWPLAAEALHGEYGLRAQWKRDFDADGWSVERDTSYHFAALKPFVEMAEAYENAGVHVFDEEFKRLFDAPVLQSPDLKSPGFTDGYVTAYERYRDPLYLRTVAVARRQPVSPPSGGFTNSILHASGLTVLRAGADDASLRTVSVNWGSPAHRGGKVMLDPKATWKGFPLNERVFRIAYGYKQSGFSYTAAAGNSLVVDGKPSSMLRVDQVAVLDGPMPAGRWTSPLHRPLYPGVGWSRTAAFCGDTFVLVDQLASERPRCFDLFAFLPHDVTGTVPAQTVWKPFPEFAGQGHGYDSFEEPEVAGEAPPTGFDYRLDAKDERPRGRLTLLSPEGTRLFRMKGYIRWHPVRVPVIVRRLENARNAWAVAAFTGRMEENAPLPAIRVLPVEREGRELPPHEALAVEVTDASGKYLLLTSEHAGAHRVAGCALEGPLATLALEGPSRASRAGQ